MAVQPGDPGCLWRAHTRLRTVARSLFCLTGSDMCHMPVDFDAVPALVYALSPSLMAHPPVWWLAKSGKLLLLLSGLAIVLDLVGHERLRNAHERATRRHTLMIEVRKLIEHSDLIYQLSRTILGSPITSMRPAGHTVRYYVEGYRFSTSPSAAIPPLVSMERVDDFVKRVTAQMRDECSCQPGQDRICLHQAEFIEAEALQEVVRLLGLSDSARSFSRTEYQRYRQDRGSSVYWATVAIFAMEAGFYYLQRMHFISTKAWYVTLGVGLLLVILLDPLHDGPKSRIDIDLRVKVAPVRLLSSWALVLLGRRATGNPVKWAALILFITGSLIDLIWG